jgi:NADPH:quinone reductase-like Zn-dependent oxidoreductase
MTMKAVVLTAYGGPENLAIQDVPKPEPGPGQVRIAMKAAALNRLDLITMAGIPGLELKLPHIVASDGAGLVDALGPGVSGYEVGQRVAFNPGLYCGKCAQCLSGEQSQCDRYMILGEHVPGSAAQFVLVPATNLITLPENVPFATAAAATLVYQTAWRMAITRARLRAGESCAVLGAGSGLSTALIQIAKLAGATVHATTSTPEKMKRAQALGADHVYDYTQGTWSKDLFKATQKRGVDVVFDSVGAKTLNDSIRSVRKGGRVVVPGGTTGQDVDLNLRYLYWKQVDLLGSTMGSQQEFETVMRLVFDGRLKPTISHTFDYTKAQEAFATLERGEQFGKIVLTFK